MLKNLSTLAIALGMGLSVTAAQAETTPIFKAPLSATDASKSKRFAINPELGRAWVEVEIYHDPAELSEVHRVAVPGLAYDREASQVVYRAEGQTVVCADVTEHGRWLFKHQRIEPTGDCELTRKYAQVPVDNGFGVDVVEHFEVHFKPASRVGMISTGSERQG